MNIPLLDIPRIILEKYSEYSNSTGLLLPIPSIQKMNYYLKEVGEECKIEKQLTFNFARHTFVLGHTQLNCIRSFIEPTNDKVQEDMAILSEKFRKIEKLFNT